MLPARTGIPSSSQDRDFCSQPTASQDRPAVGMENTATRFHAVLWVALRFQGILPFWSPLNSRNSPRAKGQHQGVLELLWGEESWGSVTQCKVAKTSLPSACSRVSLKSSAHFPRARNGSEQPLLQTPFSMGQAFIPLPGIKNPEHLDFYGLLEDPSQSNWLVSVPPWPDEVLTNAIFNKSQPKL